MIPDDVYKTLCLTPDAIKTLQGAVSLPPYADLLVLVPGLAETLAEPQVDHYDAARELLNKFFAEEEIKAVAVRNGNAPTEVHSLESLAEAPDYAPRAYSREDKLGAGPHAYTLMYQHIGSSDDPEFAPDMFFSYDDACDALIAWAKSEFPRLNDDRLVLKVYRKPEVQACWVSITLGGSVERQFCLTTFRIPPESLTRLAGEVSRSLPC